MNSPTEKTPLELYTGLSRHDLYDNGSANRRPCIWKIGDMVQTSPYSKSYDAGCYGKIVKIEKSTNDNRDSSSFGDSWWTCYYQVMGPESKSRQIGKIWGMRDYCYDPYQPEKKPVQESVNMVSSVKKSNGYQLNPLVPLLESINNDNDYDSALKIFNSLSEEDKWKLCPWHGKYKNVPVLYRHVITNKGFVDIYPHNHSKQVGFLLIATAPKYRGKGVTHDLINICFKDCKLLGIKKIWWVCANSNTDSLRAALKNGFKLQKKGKTETRLYKDL